MDFLTKLERKYGKYAIPNLTLILISGFILGYLIEIFMPEGLQLLAMNPEKILHGQIYRLVTWVVIPPSSASILVIITLFFYFSIGRTLENSWGDFRYTVYILSGIIFTDIGMMGTYLVMHLMGQSQLLDMYYQAGLYGASTYYLCMSMFLAYAFMFPDMQVLLMFVIPVKVKWMGILDAGLMVYYVIMGSLFTKFAIVASLLNFVLYFYRLHKSRISPKQMHRKAQFERKTNEGRAKATRHKCAICGRTEEYDPSLDFRFCSKCNGNYEYCQYHLFTHEHVK